MGGLPAALGGEFVVKLGFVSTLKHAKGNCGGLETPHHGFGNLTKSFSKQFDMEFFCGEDLS